MNEKMKKGISKNVPHTYRQHNQRYYALIRKVGKISEDGDLWTAYNFYMFDENGYCWFSIVHTELSFIYGLGNGLLKERTTLWVEDDKPYNNPILETDTWIQGNADRGYALEIIREGLGLNLTYLKPVLSAGEGEG